MSILQQEYFEDSGEKKGGRVLIALAVAVGVILMGVGAYRINRIQQEDYVSCMQGEGDEAACRPCLQTAQQTLTRFRQWMTNGR